MRKPFAAFAMSCLLTACGGGEKEIQDPEPPRAEAAGGSRERISVLTFEQELEADPSLSDVRIILPAPYRNTIWPQSGGIPSNAVHHLFVDETLEPVWTSDIGRGSGSYERLVHAPIVADGRLYAMDIRASVVAVDADSGQRLWKRELKAEDEKRRLGFGGGLAYAGGRVFATTGFGFISALDAENGREIWRYEGIIPFRGAPTVEDGRLFAVTQDNQVFALNANTGEVLWSEAGIAEDASLLGAASPAVAGDTVIAALSSGELFAMRVENGRMAWQDTLSRTRRLTPLATLADIDGNPVVSDGRVYAVGHAGRMVAIDIRSGERVWEVNIAGVGTPWIAGDYLYLITADSELAAVSAADGRIRWVTRLQRFEDPDDRDEPVYWTGPVLAGDRLIVASSNGFVLTLSPYTGDFISGAEIDEGTVAPPIVANAMLYVLTEGGDIVAYR